MNYNEKQIIEGNVAPQKIVVSSKKARLKAIENLKTLEDINNKLYGDRNKQQS